MNTLRLRTISIFHRIETAVYVENDNVNSQSAETLLLKYFMLIITNLRNKVYNQIFARKEQHTDRLLSVMFMNEKACLIAISINIPSLFIKTNLRYFVSSLSITKKKFSNMINVQHKMSEFPSRKAQ